MRQSERKDTKYYIRLPLPPSSHFSSLNLIPNPFSILFAKKNKRVVVNKESGCTLRVDIDVHVTHMHSSTSICIAIGMCKHVSLYNTKHTHTHIHTHTHTHNACHPVFSAILNQCSYIISINKNYNNRHMTNAKCFADLTIRTHPGVCKGAETYTCAYTETSMAQGYSFLDTHILTILTISKTLQDLNLKIKHLFGKVQLHYLE